MFRTRRNTKSIHGNRYPCYERTVGRAPGRIHSTLTVLKADDSGVALKASFIDGSVSRNKKNDEANNSTGRFEDKESSIARALNLGLKRIKLQNSPRACAGTLMHCLMRKESTLLQVG